MSDKLTFDFDETEVQNAPNDPVKPEPPQVPAVSVNLQALMSQAIDKGVPVETMERLLAMWEKLRALAVRKLYFDALRGFQAECPIIEKDTKVYDKHGNLRYKYAKIEKIVKTVSPLLIKYGFSYTIKPIQKDNKFTAVIESTHKDGHTESTSFEVPINDNAYMTAPQKVADARTFAVRYAFNDAYGIVTADGDSDGDDSGENGPPITGQNGNQKPPEKKDKPNGNSIPEKNLAFLKLIMAIVREKVNGRDLIETKEEKEKIVRAANAAVTNLEAIKAQHEALNRLANERREAIKASSNK